MISVILALVDWESCTIVDFAMRDLRDGKKRELKKTEVCDVILKATETYEVTYVLENKYAEILDIRYKNTRAPKDAFQNE
jgi:uncharacterized protein related to proFAR isomerase